MSEITSPLLLDETGKEIAAILRGNSVNLASVNIAYVYDPTVAHNAGEYRIFENELYKCVNPTNAGTAFNEVNWQRVRVMEELKYAGGGSDTLGGSGSDTPGGGTIIDSPVASVNGKVGVVVLTAADVGAVSSVNEKRGTNLVLNAADVGAISTVNGKSGVTIVLAAGDIGLSSTKVSSTNVKNAIEEVVDRKQDIITAVGILKRNSDGSFTNVEAVEAIGDNPSNTKLATEKAVHDYATALGGVTSVNGKVGSVVLKAGDISADSTKFSATTIKGVIEELEAEKQNAITAEGVLVRKANGVIEGKVVNTSLSETATDEQIPTAKTTYDTAYKAARNPANMFKYTNSEGVFYLCDKYADGFGLNYDKISSSNTMALNSILGYLHTSLKNETQENLYNNLFFISSYFMNLSMRGVLKNKSGETRQGLAIKVYQEESENMTPSFYGDIELYSEGDYAECITANKDGLHMHLHRADSSSTPTYEFWYDYDLDINPDYIKLSASQKSRIREILGITESSGGGGSSGGSGTAEGTVKSVDEKDPDANGNVALHALTYDAQTLTSAQKTRVLTNLGLSTTLAKKVDKVGEAAVAAGRVYAEIAQWDSSVPTTDRTVGIFVDIAGDLSGTSTLGGLRIQPCTNITKYYSIGVTVEDPAFVANYSEDYYDDDGTLKAGYAYIARTGVVVIKSENDVNPFSVVVPSINAKATTSEYGIGYMVYGKTADGDAIVNLNMSLETQMTLAAKIAAVKAAAWNTARVQCLTDLKAGLSTFFANTTMNSAASAGANAALAAIENLINSFNDEGVPGGTEFTTINNTLQVNKLPVSGYMEYVDSIVIN